MAIKLSLVAGGGMVAPFDRGYRASAEAGAELGGADSSGRIASHHYPHPEIRPPTLSELFAASSRDGGWAGFLLGQVEAKRPLLWVQDRMAILESGRVHPPGLLAPGLDLGELIHVEARDSKAALWAMEEGLRCAAIGAVIGEIWGDPTALDFTATRRLAVAAERHGVSAYLVRLGGTANLSGARLRWRVASAPSLPHPLNPRAPGLATWQAELFRARGSAPGTWRLAHEADGLHLVAEPVDRTLDEAGFQQTG